MLSLDEVSSENQEALDRIVKLKKRKNIQTCSLDAFLWWGQLLICTIFLSHVEWLIESGNTPPCFYKELDNCRWFKTTKMIIALVLLHVISQLSFLWPLKHKPNKS